MFSIAYTKLLHVLGGTDFSFTQAVFGIGLRSVSTSVGFAALVVHFFVVEKAHTKNARRN